MRRQRTLDVLARIFGASINRRTFIKCLTSKLSISDETRIQVNQRLWFMGWINTISYAANQMHMPNIPMRWGNRFQQCWCQVCIHNTVDNFPMKNISFNFSGLITIPMKWGNDDVCTANKGSDSDKWLYLILFVFMVSDEMRRQILLTYISNEMRKTNQTKPCIFFDYVNPFPMKWGDNNNRDLYHTYSSSWHS